MSNLLIDEVSVKDIPIEPTSLGEEDSRPSLESNNEEDWEVLEEELDKVTLLLKHQEAVTISITPNRRRRLFCQSHNKLSKQVIQESKEKNKESQKGQSKPISEPSNMEGKSK